MLYYPGGKDLPGLQILKLLGAIAVIHLHASNVFGPAWNIVWRLAVPCFFMISGYFMLNRLGQLEHSRIERTLKKMIKLIVLASMIYLAIKWSIDYMLDAVSPGKFSHLLDSTQSPQFWTRLFLFGDGAEAHLWYIMAYAQLLALLWLVVKIKSTRIRYLILGGAAVVSWVAILIAESYLIMGTSEIEIYGMRPYVVIRNFLTVGLPFFMLGICIRKYEHLIRNVLKNKFRIILLPIIAIILTMAEALTLRCEGVPESAAIDIYFTTIVSAVLVFLFFLLYPFERFNNKIVDCLASLGRNHSLTIYLIHPMVIVFILFLSKVLTIMSLGRISMCYYAFLTIIISIVVSFAWSKIKPVLGSHKKISIEKC